MVKNNFNYFKREMARVVLVHMGSLVNLAEREGGEGSCLRYEAYPLNESQNFCPVNRIFFY